MAQIKLTENQLHSLIAESVKKHLTEDTQLYNTTLGGGSLGTSDNFRGCPDIQIRWHGEYADPELISWGYIANYYEIEDTVVEWAKEDGIDTENNNAFNKYCQENETAIISLIKKYGKPEEDPFMAENKIKIDTKKKEIRLTENQLHNLIAESVKRILKEGSTNQKVLDVWDEMTESVGAQVMLDMIYSALSHDQLVDLIKYFNRVYEFGIDLTDIERC